MKTKQPLYALASVAQLVGAPSYRSKGHGFDSQSGHMPRLRVWFLVQYVQKVADQYFSLSSFLSLSPPLSKINKHVLG